MSVVERSYGRGYPMEMIMQEAPNAGREAHRVWNKGKPKGELLLSPDREIGVEEAIRNSFAFVQIAGLKAGESKNVANISTGLTWDRQTPIEDCAQEIVEKIGGSEVQLHWFGRHKLVGFVKGNDMPQDKLLQLVHAPTKVYPKYLPHLADAQNEIQKRRVKDILDPLDGTGREFLSIFNGEENLDRAYQDNGKYSFVWGTQKIDDKLMGTNLDNKCQSVAELATDEDTRQMLKAMQEFFAGSDSQNRYFIEFDFSETVSCCNISFNAQHEESHVWNRGVCSVPSSDIASDILKYPNGETYFSSTICVSCLKKEKSCRCKKGEEKEE